MEHYFQLRQLELYIFSLKYNISNNLDLTFLKELQIPDNSDLHFLESFFHKQKEIFKRDIYKLCNKKIAYNNDYESFKLSDRAMSEFKKYGKKLDSHYYFLDKTDQRDDPLLIKIIEKLGDDAAYYKTHSKGSIKIIKVPHFLPWYIDEYEGFETVYIILFGSNIKIYMNNENKETVYFEQCSSDNDSIEENNNQKQEENNVEEEEKN